MQHVYTFDCLSDFIRGVNITNPGNVASDIAWDDSSHIRDWAGGTRVQAFDYALHGWAEGRKKMVSAMAYAKSKTNLVADYVMDVGGAYPVAALAAAGDPCSMVNLEPVESRVRPIVRLAVNVWASCAYDADEFMNYGAAVLSYIDALESGNYRVELTMLCHCRVDGGSAGEAYSGRVLIKRAEDPLEIDRAAFCLTHPLMFRRLWFTHMQIAPEVKGRMPGCGSPLNPEPGNMEPGVIVVPGINTFSPGSSDLKTPEKAAKAMRKNMDAILSQSGIALPALVFGGEGVK